MVLFFGAKIRLWLFLVAACILSGVADKLPNLFSDLWGQAFLKFHCRAFYKFIQKSPNTGISVVISSQILKFFALARENRRGPFFFFFFVATRVLFASIWSYKKNGILFQKFPPFSQLCLQLREKSPGPSFLQQCGTLRLKITKTQNAILFTPRLERPPKLVQIKFHTKTKFSLSTLIHILQ